jgi:hypothetical protein
MNRTTRWILALLLTLVVSPAWAATTYFVSTTGNDTTGDGSVSLPWRTIQKCANTAASGDTCSVNDGTYTISSGTNLCGGSGTSSFGCVTRPGITFKSTTPLGAKLNGNSNTTDYGFHVTTGANGTVIQDFEMYGLFKDGVFIPVGATLSNAVFKGNLIHTIGRTCTSFGFGISGIFVGRGNTNLTIERNIMHNIGRTLNGTEGCAIFEGTNGDHAIYVEGSTNLTIKNNVIYDIRNGFPIHVYSTQASSSGLKILNNVFADPGLATPTPVRSPILCGEPVSSSDISNNISIDPVVGFITPIGGCVFSSTTVNNNIVTVANLFQLSGAGIATPSGVTSTTGNQLSTDPLVTNEATRDYTLTSTSPARNAGKNVSLPANGTPDIGAFETIQTPTSAIASGNFVDVALPMSANTPVLPATGQTTWVVKFSGVARTTVSAGKLTPTDSTVRIQYDGAPCASSDTITVDYTAGTVSDSALVGNTLNQKLFSFTGLTVDESACGGTPPDPPSGPHIVYHLNDGSGTDVTDSSGNANHGTTTGSPTWSTGMVDGALDFTDGVADYITAPYGSGVDPSNQSLTVCILVSPDSTTNTRNYFGVPIGTNQRGFLGTINGTWAFGIQNRSVGTNNEFPVQAGWSFPCIVWDSTTDTATLWVNAVKGTTTNGNGASVKTYTFYTFSGNFTIGMANGFNVSTAPGGVIDEVFFYQSALDQTEMTELYQSLITPPPPSTGTRKQNGHQFQRPFKKADAPENLRSANGEVYVARGGYVDVIFQIDCTGADCPDFGPRLHRSIDGGSTYAQLNDVCGVICFRGSANDPDLVTEEVEACLTGALTDVTGPTNVTSAAVPNVTLAEDECTVIRYKLKVASDATVGQEIYLKLFDQNSNEFEDTYVPSLGAKITVKEVGNGSGR